MLMHSPGLRSPAAKDLNGLLPLVDGLCIGGIFSTGCFAACAGQQDSFHRVLGDNANDDG